MGSRGDGRAASPNRLSQAEPQEGLRPTGFDPARMARIALGFDEAPHIERAAKAVWAAYSRHTYGRYTEDSEKAWQARAPLFRWMAMAALGTIPPHEFDDKQALIDGLFDVQTGHRSCRHMASAIWPSLEPFTRDRDGAEGGDANAAPAPKGRQARAEGIAQPGDR